MSTMALENGAGGGQPNGSQPRELTNGTTTTTQTAKSKPFVKQHERRREPGAWKVKASAGALNTSNPIREIIETMNLAENPKKKVIPLSIGDPTIFGNLKPCKEILDAIEKANNCGKYYGYQIAAGMEAARDAVAEYHFKCTGNRIKRQDVILASGCSHAIDLSICVLAQHGQNILIPRPGFPLYKTLTSVYGVEFKQYDLLADQNWSIDLRHLESLIDDKTAAIVINNPSNPCGSVFSRRHLLQILDLAEKYRLPIIADEIYDKFIFSPELYVESSSATTTTTTIATNTTDNTNRCRQQPQQQQSNGSNNRGKTRSHQSRHKKGRSNLENMRPNDVGKEASTPSSSSTTTTDGEEQDFEESWEELSEDHVHKIINQEDHDDEEEEQNDGFHYVPFRSLSSLSEVVPILTCGGISKTCLIPGLRLGWIIINDKQNIFDSSIRNGLNRLTQRLMGPNSLVQGALSDILTSVPESFYKQTMDFIFKNAKLCYDRLKLVRGLHPYMPQGSMYLMVRFEEHLFPSIKGDLDFTSKLMNEESVLVLPGKCFDFPNYFRICLTVPTDVMEEALIRIEEFCQRHLDVEMAAAAAAEVSTILKTNNQPSIATIVDDDADNGHKSSIGNDHKIIDADAKNKSSIKSDRKLLVANNKKISKHLPNSFNKTNNQSPSILPLSDLTSSSSNLMNNSQQQQQQKQQQQAGECK